MKFGEGQPHGPSVAPLNAKRRAVEEIKPVEDGATPELMAMRHVNLNAARWDITEPQLSARKFKKKDPKGFWMLLNDLEERHRKLKLEVEKEARIAAQPKTQPDSPEEPDAPEVDPGTARCLALAEKLLEEAAK